MSRGSRTGNLTSGDMFALIPVNVPQATDHTSPLFAYDLNADVAGALLGVDAATVWRYATRGRSGVFLHCEFPYGRGSKRYYSLVGLEDFASRAWKKFRRLNYSIMPLWYAEKHERDDLYAKCRQRVTAASVRFEAMPADERMAVDLGWPRGTWAEAYSDGVHVFGPSSMRLNGVHKTEAEWMRARDEVTALGGDADTLLGKEFDKSG